MKNKTEIKSEIETLEVAGFASGHSIHLHEHEHVVREEKKKNLSKSLIFCRKNSKIDIIYSI